MLQAVCGLQHLGALGLVCELAASDTSTFEQYWSMVDMLLAAGADVSGKVTSGLVMSV